MAQNMILQQQLAEISLQLKVLQRSVDHIAREMHLDRCAKIHAALLQTRNAISLSESDPLRLPLLVEASTLALEGMEQIKAAVENRIKLLCSMEEKGFMSYVWTKHPQDEVDQHVRMLSAQIYDLHQGVYNAAYVSLYLGRPQFAKNIIEDYKNFLDRVFTKQVKLTLNSQAGNKPEIEAWNKSCQKVARKLDDYLQRIEKYAPQELCYGGNEM